MIGRFRYRVKLEFPLHIYTLVVLLTEQYMYSYCSGVGTMGTEGASLHCTPKFRTCILCTPPPSERCGLCQNFKQTISTTRLYKVRTNLYSPLTKTFRRAWLFARLHNYGIQDFRATCCGGSEFFT